MASDREVLAYVRLKPGAIGYVSLDADVTGVKVVAVGGKTEHALGDRGRRRCRSAAASRCRSASCTRSRSIRRSPRSARCRAPSTCRWSSMPTATSSSAQVVQSIPQLDAAAVEAVKKWKYSPTVVNGVACPSRWSCKSRSRCSGRGRTTIAEGAVMVAERRTIGEKLYAGDGRAAAADGPRGRRRRVGLGAHRRPTSTR